MYMNKKKKIKTYLLIKNIEKNKNINLNQKVYLLYLSNIINKF